MRIAILAHRGNTFVPPMARGLEVLLRQAGASPHIFHHGLNVLNLQPSGTSRKARLKVLVKKLLLGPFLAQLRGFDAVVVVGTIPEAFRRSLAVDAIRRRFPSLPVVLYDVVYLPTVGRWGPWVDDETLYAGRRHEYAVMDRYDWYLCASDTNRYGMPPGPQPCSRIGLHLDDGSLFPEQRGRCSALIDFERPTQRKERERQIAALTATNTPYETLAGEYPIREIRKIYRRTSLYFLAWMESFGLPIAEIQACGGLVFTPHADWCQSHGVKSDPAADGLGALSPNFVVYGTDKDGLIREIERAKATYDPAEVRRRFEQYHPQLLRGDTKAVSAFLTGLEQGRINSRCHTEYGQFLARSPLRVDPDGE